MKLPTSEGKQKLILDGIIWAQNGTLEGARALVDLPGCKHPTSNMWGQEDVWMLGDGVLRIPGLAPLDVQPQATNVAARKSLCNCIVVQQATCSPPQV